MSRISKAKSFIYDYVKETKRQNNEVGETFQLTFSKQWPCLDASLDADSTLASDETCIAKQWLLNSTSKTTTAINHSRCLLISNGQP